MSNVDRWLPMDFHQNWKFDRMFNLLFAHRISPFFCTFHPSSSTTSLIHLHHCEFRALETFTWFSCWYFCYLLTVQCSLFIFFACLARWKNIFSDCLLLVLYTLSLLFSVCICLLSMHIRFEKFSSAQFYIQRLSFADSSKFCLERIMHSLRKKRETKI